jgi:hypothetical protein
MSLECSRLQARTLRSPRTSSRNRLAVSKLYGAWAIIFALSSHAIFAGATVSVRMPSPPDALCSAVMGCGCRVSQSSTAPACMCEDGLRMPRLAVLYCAGMHVRRWAADAASRSPLLRRHACAKPCVVQAYLCGGMRSRHRSPPPLTRRVLRCAPRAAPS